MFVSSYNTYIQPNTSEKVLKERNTKQVSDSSSFSSKLSQTIDSSQLKESAIPLEFLSKSQVFSNKREIEYQRQQLEVPQKKDSNETQEILNRFSGKSTLENAKTAYETNSKMFSLRVKPKIALQQESIIDTNLPPKAQEAKEQNIRVTMINTYIQNDNYYKITA